MSRSTTEPTHPHLEGLIRKWREDAETIACSHEDQAYRNAMSDCADELEAALAALPGGGVDELEGAARGLLREVDARCVGGRLEGTTDFAKAAARLRAALSPPPNPHEADRNGWGLE